MGLGSEGACEGDNGMLAPFCFLDAQSEWPSLPCDPSMVTPQSQSTLCPQLRTTSPRGPWTDTPEIMIKVSPTSIEVGLSQVLVAIVGMQTTLITTMIDTVFGDEENNR